MPATTVIEMNERLRLAMRLALDDLSAIMARRKRRLAERIVANPAVAREALADDAEQLAATFQAAFERRCAELGAKP